MSNIFLQAGPFSHYRGSLLPCMVSKVVQRLPSQTYSPLYSG